MSILLENLQSISVKQTDKSKNELPRIGLLLLEIAHAIGTAWIYSTLETK